jgi:hypothetical protein
MRVRQFVAGVSHPIPQVYDSDRIMVSRSPVPEAAPQIALPWIIRLRYGMMLGQILTAIVVHFLLKIDTSW